MRPANISRISAINQTYNQETERLDNPFAPPKRAENGESNQYEVEELLR